MTARISSLPLVVAYIVFPSFFILTRNVGLEFTRNWIDAVWLLLGFFAFASIVLHGRVFVNRRFRLVAAAGMAFFIFIVVLRFGVSLFSAANTIPFVMELKPVFYLAVALLWVCAFGSLKPGQFKTCGAWLGAIMVADFFLEAALAGHIVRPLGSGEPNYDALLLLISLCTFFSDADAIEGRKGAFMLVFMGLLATFSRTALVTAGVIVFIFSQVGVPKKALIGVVCVSFVVLSFMIRDLPLDVIESMDRYWMWYSGVDLIMSHPWEALWGFPAGVSLPIDIPTPLASLWTAQQEGWGVSGVFPYNYHSFWLRMAITWGLVLLSVSLVASLFVLLAKRYPVFLKSIVLLVFLEGFTMGVFYLGNVAVPMFLVLGLALSEYLAAPSRPSLRTRGNALSVGRCL